MALSTAELYRIKAELGFNTLQVGAEPYISYVSLFDSIIAPYLQGGASTTSATTVTASTTAAAWTLVLADATGFTAGDQVFIDVDDSQEQATIRSLSGSSMGVLLRLGHSGTYPVTVDGGEGVVREYLKKIRAVKTELGETFGTGSLRKVDEVEFYDTRGRTAFGNLGDQLMFWRDELASALGIRSAWSAKRAGSSRVAVY